MEKLLLIIIILLILLLIISFIIFSYLLFKNLVKGSSVKLELDSEAKKDLLKKKIKKDYKNLLNQNESLSNFCIDHSELPAKGNCSISDEAYCELCLTRHDDIKMARKYLDLYLDHNWKELRMLKTEELGADKYNEILKFKKQKWKEEKLPIICQKQFKINVEEDKTEEFLSFIVREEDFQDIEETFNKLV